MNYACQKCHCVGVRLYRQHTKRLCFLCCDDIEAVPEKTGCIIDKWVKLPLGLVVLSMFCK